MQFCIKGGKTMLKSRKIAPSGSQTQASQSTSWLCDKKKAEFTQEILLISNVIFQLLSLSQNKMCDVAPNFHSGPLTAVCE